jgi:hypothetical protein
MKYIKPIDIWQYADAVMSGQIKLQKGQWIRLGPEGTLSRFGHASRYHIRAYHYPNANRQFMQVEGKQA